MERPEPLIDVIDRISKYPDLIFVRTAKGETVQLDQLPAREAIQRACKWILEAYIAQIYWEEDTRHQRPK